MRRSIPLTCLALTALIASASSVFAASPSAKAKTQVIGTKTLNVIVLIYDPILKNRDNQKLTQYMKWNDSRKLSQALVDDVKKASGGYVNYKIVDTIEYDGFPMKRSGFLYTDETFLNMWEKNRDKADPSKAGWKHMFEQFGMYDRIKKQNISEIWVWGAPYMHFDEYQWKIPGDKIPYQTDNPWFYRPYDIPDIGKTIWIMGFSYERGEGEMLESYSHRIEGVLSLTVGKGVWDTKKGGDNVWNKFTRVDKDFPGESEVGSVHYAPNSPKDYDWDNQKEVWTYADDWLTYPKLPRQKKLLNAQSGGWGKTADASPIVNHHRWWLTHLPKAPGVTDGFYNNWWQYIVNYDEAIKKLSPPGATFQKAKAAMYGD